VTDVAVVVADVRERGDAALRDWSERLGDGAPGRLTPRAQLGPPLLGAIRTLAGAVEAVHRAQRPPDTTVTPAPGIEVSRRWLPLDSVGIYVPSGLPSSLVMTAVPARLAGVPRIAVATPRPSETMLGVARELGIEELYAMGGPQAIAALAFGTETVAPVDVIAGPGGPYVQEAKLQRSPSGPRPSSPSRRSSARATAG
jgi:histidinol dehydrogenase